MHNIYIHILKGIPEIICCEIQKFTMPQLWRQSNTLLTRNDTENSVEFFAERVNNFTPMLTHEISLSKTQHLNEDIIVGKTSVFINWFVYASCLETPLFPELMNTSSADPCSWSTLLKSHLASRTFQASQVPLLLPELLPSGDVALPRLSAFADYTTSRGLVVSFCCLSLPQMGTIIASNSPPV